MDLLAELKIFQQPSELQLAASVAEVAALVQQAAIQLGYVPPAFYLELLRTTDGIARNGIQMYDAGTRRIAGSTRESFVQGLIEANLVWREFEPNKDYIFFAESGSDLYQHNLQTNQFENADRVGRTVFDRFATAEELFEKLFNHLLDRYDSAEEEA